MIKNLWETPILFKSADTEILQNFVNHLLVNHKVFNPPNDDSKINVLDDQSEPVQLFLNKVVKTSFDDFLRQTTNKSLSDWSGYKLSSWLTGSGNDYSMPSHNHRGAQLSSVFYLLCEEIPAGGDIVFVDPRVNSNRGYDRSFEPWFKELRITPKTGDIVVFPSFVYHHVETYRSNIRLALPVDCFLFADS